MGKLVEQVSRITAEDQESCNWKVQEADTEDPSLKHGSEGSSNSSWETAGILKNLWESSHSAAKKKLFSSYWQEVIVNLSSVLMSDCTISQRQMTSTSLCLLNLMRVPLTWSPLTQNTYRAGDSGKCSPWFLQGMGMMPSWQQTI